MDSVRISHDLGNACSGFNDTEIQELREIAALYSDAGGLIMQLANWAGSGTEVLLGKLPAPLQDRIAEASELALREAYNLAFNTQPASTVIENESFVGRALTWAQGERWHKVAASVTGALGGVGGLATTILDLPVTTTLILRSIQQIAIAHGENVGDPEVRAQCIAVFGLGDPLREDDESETGLFASRVALNGKVLAEVLGKVLPRFGFVVSEKLLAQAAPLLGSLAGATINPVFAGYYQTMAHVHFRLRKLERSHDANQVQACFERIVRSRRTAEAEASAQAASRRVAKA